MGSAKVAGFWGWIDGVRELGSGVGTLALGLWVG